MTTARLALICAVASSPVGARAAPSRTHRLDPSPTTVAWGHYDAASKPADPTTLAGAILLLIAAALVAAWMPAHR